jgi:alkanesulfonate monooxygenase SsuD/methylene tetrahydromethanopterin reductase-like flavin-dependent oxidoreductase (luciferase family)
LLRFGIIRNFTIPWDQIVEQWLRFEDAGFDSVWGIDHFQRPTDPTDPLLEAWTALAALAALTKRVRIGILVSSNTFRAPALLAKEAVTVDHISRGRLEFGIGAGGFETEHGLWGIAYPDPAERVDRLVEAIQLFDHLMRNDAIAFKGRFTQIDGALFRPGPVQRPRPPITLGAHGPRMLKIVAQYADRWNSYGTVAEMRERNAAIDQHCSENGRDPRAIIRSFYVRTQTVGIEPWASVAGFHDVVTQYRAAGIDEFIFEPPQDDQWAMMDTIAAEEIPALRAAAR